MQQPYAPFKIEADGQHLGPGAVYHGGVLLADGGTATVLLYDGDDANGVLIDRLKATNGNMEHRVIERGIRLLKGLYVDVSTNVGDLTLFLEPAPKE